MERGVGAGFRRPERLDQLESAIPDFRAAEARWVDARDAPTPELCCENLGVATSRGLEQPPGVRLAEAVTVMKMLIGGDVGGC
ncbi:hypothetical protein BE11_12800 [Sorangium cellulosum]|nr:hypothetical protein BE11_12800 [Sorangium cellulosum]